MTPTPHIVALQEVCARFALALAVLLGSRACSV